MVYRTSSFAVDFELPVETLASKFFFVEFLTRLVKGNSKSSSMYATVEVPKHWRVELHCRPLTTIRSLRR